MKIISAVPLQRLAGGLSIFGGCVLVGSAAGFPECLRKPARQFLIPAFILDIRFKSNSWHDNCLCGKDMSLPLRYQIGHFRGQATRRPDGHAFVASGLPR